jgi:hypothetical protein
MRRKADKQENKEFQKQSYNGQSSSHVIMSNSYARFLSIAQTNDRLAVLLVDSQCSQQENWDYCLLTYAK